MARRRRATEANIWPGFVDGLSTLLLVLMFVLSIFVVAQFYLGERLTSVKDELAGKDAELIRLTERINQLAEQLGLAKAEKDALQRQILSLQTTIEEKDNELAALGTALAASQAAVAASAEELEAEKALSDDQKSQIATLNAQLAALRKQLQSLQEALEAAEAKDKEQKAQIENLSQRLNAALARKIQELQEVRSRFFEEMRAALEGFAGIEVDGDRFSIGGDALFGSCEASLSPRGREALNKVAEAIFEVDRRIKAQITGREGLAATQAIQNWIIRVDGHADSVPLGPACAAKFIDNKGLSAARALAVTRYLEGRGVPSKRLVATGLGSDYPVTSGSSASALARNRRIEFKLTER
ncbi:MAG: peptidoglycan-binding protein [Pseudomonadota bacterium]